MTLEKTKHLKRIFAILSVIVVIVTLAYASVEKEIASRRYIAPSRAVDYSKRPIDTRLVDAARAGDLGKVTRLLKMGASPDSIDGSTEGGQGEALQAAAVNGHVAVVQLLLDKGADINAPDFWGGTALVSAAAADQTQVVKLLLSRGADVNASDDGATALGYAQHQGYSEVVKLLKQAGANE